MLNNVKKIINEEYVNSEISKINDGDLDLVMDNSKEINEKIENSGALKKYTELGKLMFGMLKDFRKGAYANVPWFTITSIGFILLYVFNPFDIIPDFIPGVGYIDDVAIFAVVLRFIQSDLNDYLDWKIATKNPEKAL